MSRPVIPRIERPPVTRPDVLLSLAILSVALGIRLVYVFQLRENPLFDAPVMDERYHDEWAVAIAEGRTFMKEPYFRAPLYPGLLGVVYAIAGHDYLVPRILQAILGSLSCVVLYWIGREVFTRAVGFVAAIAAAGYWILVYFDGELLISCLLVFLDLVLILTLLRAWRAPGKLLFTAAGVILGLSAIARPNILLFAPFVLAWIAILSRGHRAPAIANMVCFCVGAALMIAPVAIRNSVVGGDRVLISSQGGVNFYIGNNPQSDGRTAIVPGTPGGWWAGYHATIARAEAALGRKLKPSEVSSYYYREGWRFIRDHPREALALYVLKLRLWWTRGEVPNDKGINFWTEQFTPIVRWLPLGFGVVGPLGLVGLALALRQPVRLFPLWGFILVYMASFLPFFCTSRYRVPTIPPLILLGAYAVFEIIAAGARFRWRLLVLAASVAAAGTALVHVTPDTKPFRSDAFDYARLALAYSGKAQVGRAEEAYQKALAIAPYFVTARINYGSLLLRVGRWQEAVTQFQAGISSNHRLMGETGELNAVAHFQLAQALNWLGKDVAAQPHYATAAALDAKYSSGSRPQLIARARELLESGMGHFAQGRFEEAVTALRSCLQFDKQNYRAMNYLAHSLVRTGQPDAAYETFRGMLAIDAGQAALDLALLAVMHPNDTDRTAAAALKYARHACPDPDECGLLALDALGMAYAATADYSRAAALAKLGIGRAGRATRAQDQAFAEVFRLRLTSYQAGQPARPLTAGPADPSP